MICHILGSAYVLRRSRQEYVSRDGRQLFDSLPTTYGPATIGKTEIKRATYKNPKGVF